LSTRAKDFVGQDKRELLQLWLERNDGAYRAIASTPS